MQKYFYRPALALLLGVSGFATVASAQKPPAASVPTVQTAPQAQPKVQVIAADTASTPPICYAGYGLRPSQKIKVCTDVIDSGSVKGLAMGLAYFNRGLARANDGDPKGSVSDYRTALRFYTDAIRSSAPSAQVVFQRGLIYHTMGDADQAIVDYSDAIRLSPRDIYAYVNRGIVLYTKKDNNEGAISDFDAALKINRCEATAWINRGLVYKRKGNLNQSIADFTDAIKCLPANSPPVTTVTVDPAGKPFPAQYYQAMTQSSQLADAYYQRGLVYLDKGSKDKKQAIPMFAAAIKDFNDAIRINPTAAGHFVGRASARMYKEEFREAIADFTEAHPAVAGRRVHLPASRHRLSFGQRARQRHRRLQRGASHQSARHGAAAQPRHRLLFQEGPVRPRDQGLHRLPEARSEGSELPDQPRHLVAREGRSGQGDRRLHRGAAARPADRRRAAVRLQGARGGAPLGAGGARALPARHGLCAEDRVRPGAGGLQRIDPAQPDRGPRVRRARRRLSRPPGIQARHRRLRRGHPARSRIRLRLFPARLRLSCDRGAG